jgi:hypothetical protein
VGLPLGAALLTLCSVSWFADTPSGAHPEPSQLAMDRIQCEGEVLVQRLAECVERFEAAQWASDPLRVAAQG